MHGPSPFDDWHVCEDCGGEGVMFLDNGPSGITRPCNECGGEGGWPDEMEEAA